MEKAAKKNKKVISAHLLEEPGKDVEGGEYLNNNSYLLF